MPVGQFSHHCEQRKLSLFKLKIVRPHKFFIEWKLLCKIYMAWHSPPEKSWVHSSSRLLQPVRFTVKCFKKIYSDRLCPVLDYTQSKLGAVPCPGPYPFKLGAVQLPKPEPFKPCAVLCPDTTQSNSALSHVQDKIQSNSALSHVLDQI